jgi:tRNA pseudouridine55 synthase
MKITKEIFNGILVVNKPEGRTSSQLTGEIRHRLKMEKVGHLGTLDPMACGVLPLAINEATKALPFLEEGEKTYEATILLGKISNTYDRTGEVTETKACFLDACNAAKMEETLKSFRGRISQIPPRFSAIHVGGKRAYELARKGVSFELEPRVVTIVQLDLVQYQHPSAILRIACSKGTYIRSLVHDIGQKLQTGAILTGLTRLASGPFMLKDAVEVEAIRSDFPKYCRRLFQFFKDLPMVTIRETQKKKILASGLLLDLGSVPSGRFILLDDEKNIVAFANSQSGKVKVERVFNFPN